MTSKAHDVALARTRLTQAVKDVESRTAAEVVVALERHSGDYLASDLLCASLVAFLVLLALSVLPHPFEDAAFVLDPSFGFLLAFLASRRIDRLRRVFCSSRRLRKNVETAALVTFMTHGVGRLSRRNGLLVYASQLERAVVVVPDIGVDVRQLGDLWPAAVARVEASLRPTLNLDTFEAGLKGLGPLLGRILPETGDDRNELPDEVIVE